MTEPLKATFVLTSTSFNSSSREGDGRATALSFEGVGLGDAAASSASVSCRSSQSENTDAARRAADRRDIYVARVRIAVMSERVGDMVEG